MRGEDGIPCLFHEWEEERQHEVQYSTKIELYLKCPGYFKSMYIYVLYCTPFFFVNVSCLYTILHLLHPFRRMIVQWFFLMSKDVHPCYKISDSCLFIFWCGRLWGGHQRSKKLESRLWGVRMEFHACFTSEKKNANMKCSTAQR